MKKTISQFELSDMLLTYVADENDRVGLELIPLSKKNELDENKTYEIDSLVQVCVRGDDFSNGFANGLTMRNGQSTCNLKFKQQLVEQDKDRTTITTILNTISGHVAKHILTFKEGTKAFRTKTIYRNESDTSICLEMLSSFSIGAITPFVSGEATNSTIAHRLRSSWSVEGKLVSSSLEQMQLEPSWARLGVRVEKFGQIGSMPVRNYFPFVAVEDYVSKVTWAAQIACPSSWQIELYRKDDALCISGGLADYDFGHWMKTLQPSEQIETPEAIITVGNGSVDEVSQRILTEHVKSDICNEKLPVVFNEYCTTWGTPSHENIKNIVETVKSKGIKYFIIDAGWYADKSNGWFTTNGDWIVSDELFPYGLEKTVELITNAGMIPGIWFELETCSTQSKMFKNEEHLLKRNGYVITSGNRRFLDMNDPWVNEYLTEKVIGMLKKYGFKYIKVDYNETIGVGCDGAESLGEGLKQNMLATQAFFKKIRAEIPDIVIENCSSGGHRLEPSMMALSDMASFSDAHECREIPIIAANLHRAIQPSKSQIWAVLRKTDSLQRIAYSLAGTFLGVMCLSGDVNDLDSEQWKLVDKGIDFYNSVSHIIASGETRYFGSLVGSYRSPEGWQAVVRYSEDKNEIMVVVHTFGGSLPENIQIPLEGTYKIKDSYVVDSKLSIEGNNLNISEISGFQATAVYLSY